MGALDRWLDLLRQDVTQALRRLRRAPFVSGVALLTLTLAIGANSAIFSVVNALLLRDLPVRDPGSLVEPLSRVPAPGEPRTNFFPAKFYEHYRDRNHVFSALIGASPARFTLRATPTSSGSPSAAIELDGDYVTDTFFDTLGLQPARGRLLTAQDQRANQTPAVVISWTLWQRTFNADPAILGRTITLNDTPATIVGIAPRAFFGLQVGMRPQVWLPMAAAPKPPPVRILGRLAPGVSIEQARAEMRVLDRVRVEALTQRDPNPLLKRVEIDLQPARGGFAALRDLYASQLWMLMALVFLLLLIGCTSLATLQLAAGAARRREMALRVALGASRWRIARQVLTESLLLSVTGAMLGLFVAHVGAAALVRSWQRDVRLRGRTIDVDVALDPHVLLFTATLAILAALLFGVASAWHAVSPRLAAPLAEIGTQAETRGRRWFGQTLIAAQVAVSLVLVCAAALFAGHLAQLRTAAYLGFDREAVLLFTVDPRGAGLSRPQLLARYRVLLARLSASPGVQSATISGVTPIEGAGWSRTIQVEGAVDGDGRAAFASNGARDDDAYVSVNAVAPRYFETFGTPLIAGRDFRASDALIPAVGGAPTAGSAVAGAVAPATAASADVAARDARTVRRAIVNQALARRYFGTRDPIGRRFLFRDDAKVTYEIVGLAADAKYSELHLAPPPTIYVDAFSEERAGLTRIAVRTALPPRMVMADARRAIEETLPAVAVRKSTTMVEQVDGALRAERMLAALAGWTGAIGAALAAIGLYGLLAFTVARRTREIGVRMALGATRAQVMTLVVRHALTMVAAGLAIGVPIALGSRRLASHLVESLSIGSLMPLSAGVCGMLLVALLAAFLPARRAARVEPMEALRRD